MFGPAGIAYVYLVYGMYHCLNVVTEPGGVPAAVLIRAAEPVEGVEAMRAARAAHRPSRTGISDARIASGPGVLCAAMSIDRSDSGCDLLDAAAPLRLEVPVTPLPGDRIGASPRIGIAYAAEPWRSQPWRFVDRASVAVSGPR